MISDKKSRTTMYRLQVLLFLLVAGIGYISAQYHNSLLMYDPDAYYDRDYIGYGDYLPYPYSAGLSSLDLGAVPAPAAPAPVPALAPTYSRQSTSSVAPRRRTISSPYTRRYRSRGTIPISRPSIFSPYHPGYGE